ncbi:cellulose-binding domain-containing protein [Streptomyces yaanensis]|uniref:Cellulose-binding domain-containing protein n=1 Tax=Streptomyces yaanensis TaxID=1142239 RepID=A0ABV7SE89_9ACTN|nr:cellulose-binding domain-containing protein [Streptomyces sp. CGMCC 4.7035]WNB98593.1 cellulose-binding domain-containing protein [Streptomyces sp. CGMCC 4.7035]
MPDLPTPQDAAEAALFSECWDAVLSYADLCTSGSAAGRHLATEAFTHGIHEARIAEAQARTTGRRTPRLPGIPLLLTSVRTSAAAWETEGKGQWLDPELRLWLNSEKAARYTGPPLLRPLALRGLRDMQEPDAALLWLAEVEALPLPDVARRLGLDPAAVATELAQVRALFRDRCQRNHLDTPMDVECRSYSRLLDAVTRAPGAETPEDLSRHLAVCVQCAEAAACLRLHGGGTPAALASGVIGWGGLAYLERRRRAAESGLSGGRAHAGTDRGIAPGIVTRPRIGKTGILAAAVIVSALALTVSLMQLGDSGGQASASGDSSDRPVAGATPSLPSLGTVSGNAAVGTSSTSRPSHTHNSTKNDDSDTEPQGKSTLPVDVSSAASGSAEDPRSTCRVKYEVVNQWPDGFQATVTVTTTEALDDWSIGWTFRDGQHVTQMWDGAFTQNGSKVTARANDYNKKVAANGSFAVGFLSSWSGSNSQPRDFTVNGDSCSTAR